MFLCMCQLFPEVERLKDGTVSLNVGCLQVIQLAATFSYQTEQCTLCAVVFFIRLHVFGKMGDTV